MSNEVVRCGACDSGSRRIRCALDAADGTDFDATAHALLTDPQTSGGLLVSCSPDSADEVLAIFSGLGFTRAATVGRMLPRQGKSLVVSA